MAHDEGVLPQERKRLYRKVRKHSHAVGPIKDPTAETLLAGHVSPDKAFSPRSLVLRQLIASGANGNLFKRVQKGLPPLYRFTDEAEFEAFCSQYDQWIRRQEMAHTIHRILELFVLTLLDANPKEADSKLTARQVANGIDKRGGGRITDADIHAFYIKLDQDLVSHEQVAADPTTPTVVPGPRYWLNPKARIQLGKERWKNVEHTIATRGEILSEVSLCQLLVGVHPTISTDNLYDWFLVARSRGTLVRIESSSEGLMYLLSRADWEASQQQEESETDELAGDFTADEPVFAGEPTTVPEAEEPDDDDADESRKPGKVPYDLATRQAIMAIVIDILTQAGGRLSTTGLFNEFEARILGQSFVRTPTNPKALGKLIWFMTKDAEHPVIRRSKEGVITYYKIASQAPADIAPQAASVQAGSVTLRESPEALAAFINLVTEVLKDKGGVLIGSVLFKLAEMRKAEMGEWEGLFPVNAPGFAATFRGIARGDNPLEYENADGTIYYRLRQTAGAVNNQILEVAEVRGEIPKFAGEVVAELMEFAVNLTRTVIAGKMGQKYVMLHVSDANIMTFKFEVVCVRRTILFRDEAGVINEDADPFSEQVEVKVIGGLKRENQREEHLRPFEVSFDNGKSFHKLPAGAVISIASI